MCNDELKPEIEASPQELAYRSRRYNDIQILVRRDQRCTSCGNLVSIKSGLISFHPVLGILQCETCSGRLKGLTPTSEANTTDNCLICGLTGTVYPCSKEDCKYKFCKKCIKRNTSVTLLAAEAGRWKCFVCSPQPLWELRAICASIMLSNSRRLKNAPTYSSHAQSRIAKTKGLTRSLRKFCDDDSSSASSDRKKSSSLLTDSDTEENKKDNKALKIRRKSEPSDQKSKKVEEGKGLKSSHSNNKKVSSKISESKSDETLDRITSDSDNEIFSVKSKAAERTTSRGKGQKHQYHVDSDHNAKKLSNKTTKKDTKITKCKIPISKTQGVRFKLQVVKILNRFKELCAEYELHMEHFKIQHFRKEISHMETAEEIVRKSSGLIREVTTSLHEQEKKMNDFFRTFKEEAMQKGDSDSEETSPFELVPFEEEAEREEVKHRGNKESLNKSKDKDRPSSASTMKQKKAFLSSDPEGEKDKKHNERKNKETDDAAEDNKQSSRKQENDKQEETEKESNATEPDKDKDKDDTLEVDSEASVYDINEIFSDEEMNVQRPNNKKEPSTTQSKKEKATENKDSKSGADKENTLKKTKLSDKTSLTEDEALIEDAKEREEDHVKKITRKGNQEAEDGANERGEENGSEALDASGKESDVQKDESDETENISEKTLSKEKNNTICNEASEASKKTKEGDLHGADDTEKDEEESLSETTLSPILKARKLAKFPTTEEINESLNDIFDCSLDNDESNANFTEAIDEGTEQIISDASGGDTSVQNPTEAKINGFSSTDKSKQGLSSQAKTKPTESAKKEVLKAGANKESSGKGKGHTDSEEESAKRMMLEDSESEDDLNVEDVSEKSFEDDRQKISESVEPTKSKEAEHMQPGRVNDESDDENKEKIENSSKAKGEKRRKRSEKDKAGESSTEQEEDSEKQNKNTGKVVSVKSRHTEDDVESDITEILVLDDSSFEKDKDHNSFSVSLKAIKKETEKGSSLEETEEKAKKDLLDSNSDDSSSGRKSKGESNKKSHKKKTGSSNSDSDSSDNEDRHLTRRLRKRKLTQKDSIGTRAKRSRIQLDVSRFNDSKLEMCCSVAIQRMSGELLDKYKKALKRSKLRLDKKAIKKLIDLERLGRDKKNETCNATDSTGQSKNRGKKKAKKTGSTLMDHLDLNQTGNDKGASEGDDHDSDFDEEANNVAKSKPRLQTDEELMREADLESKVLLLHSSDSDIDVDVVADNGSEKEVEEKESSKKTKEKKKSQSDKRSTTEDYEKSRWRKCKVLTGKLSDLDEEEESRQWKVKKEKLDAEDAMRKDQEGKDQNEKQVKRRTRRTRRRIFDSDSNIESSTNSEDDESQKSSEGSDSSVFSKSKKKRTRKRSKSSDTDTSLGEKKAKTKRRRIKKVASDSDSDTSKIPNSQENSGGKGRKNIRKVLKDKQVADDTKQAAKEEEERLKRIAERQRLYNEMYEARLAGEKKVEKLVLDFNPDTKEELVVVDENLVKKLKPHQAEGIKFMWDACFESVEQIKKTPGSGCILAHCMGLGKSLQVVGLVHTLLTHEETGVKTVLVVCPLSTVLNWMNEFQIWMKDVETGDDVNVYEMTRFKKNFERKCQLEHWHRTTGVMIISYNMFRSLTGPSKMGKKMKESIVGSLVDPGPDLVICDEGHLLKNEDTALSRCMKKIKTLRRIVLTGTPLQNNLVEYHCMVQFVKPSLLGTKKEFLNRFVNPITNGQFDDSTAYDVKLMKKRAYVLHQMLKGCVQRFDYSVLMPFLPPKQEYVIFVTLTDVQIKMYKHYLQNFAGHLRGVGRLFADFQALQRIWTHPIILQLNAEKINERRRYSSESEDSMKDFVKDTTSESESEDSSVVSNDSSNDDEVQAIHDSRNQNSDASKNSKGVVEGKEKGGDATEKDDSEKEEQEWWMEYAQPEHLEDMRTSSKLVLLFGILKECEKIGDKVLVFSQSLYSLTLIEQFLERIDEQTRKGTESENLLGHSGSWTLGLDYFRLDGQTSADNRRKWCKIFNRPTNTRARLFLISTRAGGLGINLTAANRVIIFDASWNPSHDVQSIFRVFRFGQKKPCYVYRFLASGTMEEKIYNRQVTKLSLSCRVIDEQQIERHYSNHDLNELYTFDPNLSEQRPTLALPKDRLLAEIFLKYKDCVDNYHEHDSLLENKVGEELDEEERKMAWLEYEEEKKGKIVQPYMHMPMYQGGMVSDQFELPVTSSAALQIDYENLQQLISKDYPNATPEQQRTMTNRALREMYNYWERQAMLRPANNSMMGQNALFDNMPRQRAIMMNPQVPTGGTVPQIPQIHGIPNVNANINSNINANFVPNPFVYRNVEPNPPTVQDDDVVEVSTNAVMPQAHQSNNQNKEQEE